MTRPARGERKSRGGCATCPDGLAGAMEEAAVTPRPTNEGCKSEPTTVTEGEEVDYEAVLGLVADTLTMDCSVKWEVGGVTLADATSSLNSTGNSVIPASKAGNVYISTHQELIDTFGPGELPLNLTVELENDGIWEFDCTPITVKAPSGGGDPDPEPRPRRGVSSGTLKSAGFGALAFGVAELLRNR